MENFIPNSKILHKNTYFFFKSNVQSLVLYTIQTTESLNLYKIGARLVNVIVHRLSKEFTTLLTN